MDKIYIQTSDAPLHELQPHIHLYAGRPYLRTLSQMTEMRVSSYQEGRVYMMPSTVRKYSNI